MRFQPAYKCAKCGGLKLQERNAMESYEQDDKRLSRRIKVLFCHSCGVVMRK